MEFDLSESALERAIGLSKGQIYQWRKGTNPTMRSLEKVAAYFNLTVNELMSESTPEGGSPVSIPVIAHPSSEPGIINIIPDSISSISDCFGIIVTDDSMSPEIQRGDLVIAEKNSEISSGDIVAICFPGDPPVCRRILYDADGFILQPLNTEYEPEHFSGSDADTEPVILEGKIVSNIRHYK